MRRTGPAWLLVMMAGGLACGGRTPPARAPSAAAVTVAAGTFGGWPALAVRNGVAEVVVVPSIGRVMAFGLTGAEATFWKHPKLGPRLAPDDSGWINFGGDKTWPSPQEHWAAVEGKGWPPPRTFDRAPYSAKATVDGVEMVSEVDRAYGVRVRRRISIAPGAAVMTIDTRYEKVAGRPIRVGVWTITQLVSPERLAARLPEKSAFPGGYAKRLDVAPRDLRLDGRLLSLARDRGAKTMIATDAEALLWIGSGPDLLIERVAGDDRGRTWPGGAHAQIYTSSDDAEPYVELELLERLHDLRVGDSTHMTVRYTLVPRTSGDPVAEAKRVLALP